MKKTSILRIAAIIALMCSAGACARRQPVADQPRYYWTMINVNTSVQGDAHLVGDRLSGRAVLIDTGYPAYAEPVLIPFLRARGIARLDAVFITHPHVDHYGGLPALLDSGIEIKIIYMGDAPGEWVKAEYWGCTPEDLAALREAAARHSVPIADYAEWREFRFSDDFVLEKVGMFDAPRLLELGIGPDINELSLIARLRCGPTTALFAGDLNRSLSLRLIETCPDALKCDILKVPHHGAEGLADDEFFRKAGPRDALVPAPAALWASERCARTRAILEELGCRAWVNGLHGHVTVSFTGAGYEIASEK